MKDRNKGRISRRSGRMPVVLFIHRRTWHLRQALQPIRAYRPRRLFVFADGWKKGDAREEALCRGARDVVRRGVDWPCRLAMSCSSRRLGLKTSVERGLRRVFREVSQAVILEDDCVAQAGFFDFCEKGLRKFALDSGVMSISGSCFVASGVSIPAHAFLSRYPHCWGWATWRRAWRRYRGRLAHRELLEALRKQNFSPQEGSHWERIAGQVSRGELSSWAYFWMWAHWRTGSLALTPAINLVRNIGFDSTARHTRELAAPLRVRAGRRSRWQGLTTLAAAESRGLDRSVFQNHFWVMSGRRGWLDKIRCALRRLIG